MSNKIIRAALETKLKAWADSQTPKVPIAFENVSFTKPTGPFVECFLIPNESYNPEMSQTRTTMYGLFQVNCWAPQGTGMGGVETLANGVISAFPPMPKTGPVFIEGKPYSRSPLPEEGWVIVPVLVKYRFES
jgi:hypothetical protein